MAITSGGLGLHALLNLQRLTTLGRGAADVITVWLFGAIGWPWLLKSLGDGGADARAALLARTGLPHEALPEKLGSWRADAGFLLLIADHILESKPDLVVELGGGTTTLIAARCLHLNGSGSLISVDNDNGFAGATREMLDAQGLDAEIRAVPLATPPEGWPGLWYDHGALPERIDLLLIDGPPWVVHPFVRGAAASLFDRIPRGGTVMLDDAARPGERLVARRWKREWPEFDWVFVPGAAGTLVGTKR
jgi:predicted O-methyltransferase YrrM